MWDWHILHCGQTLRVSGQTQDSTVVSSIGKSVEQKAALWPPRPGSGEGCWVSVKDDDNVPYMAVVWQI